jgi:uncharacterized protein YjiS (DUF1127 family)
MTMAYSFQPYNTQRTGARLASLWSAGLAAIERLFDPIEHRRVIRRDVNRLMEFDDRALADIGLSRGELMHAVRHGRLPSHSSRRR